MKKHEQHFALHTYRMHDSQGQSKFSPYWCLIESPSRISSFHLALCEPLLQTSHAAAAPSPLKGKRDVDASTEAAPNAGKKMGGGGAVQTTLTVRVIRQAQETMMKCSIIAVINSISRSSSPRSVPFPLAAGREWGL